MNRTRLSLGIIDLSINNIFSVYRACLKAGFKTEIIDLKKNKLNYDIVILPGVGAFKSGMKFLKKTHLNDKLHDYLERPNSFVYGICLGMQLLFNKSYEFVETNGLELIDGSVVKFRNIKANITHLSFGVKYQLLENKSAIYFPISLTINDINSEIIKQIEPTYLHSFTLGKYFEFNPSIKALIPLDSNFKDYLLAYNLGFGISSNLSKWVIRPEVGILSSSSEEGGLPHMSIGLSVYP